jgi:pyruvate kinase
MAPPLHKTKIVATIGPASQSVEVLEGLLRAGMRIARLNFSHGEFEYHHLSIQNLREAERRTGIPVTIMADLPGPKMRIGTLTKEPIELQQGATVTLTTDIVPGDVTRLSVSFPNLPRVVARGTKISLNDGLVQLEVVQTGEKDVACRVLAGGELRSRKGLNIPDVDLGVRAFTEHDQRCLEFALREGVEAVSQSFVESAADLKAVRAAAADLGKYPFVIAKIERSRALENIDTILDEADGVMIARGDLGVEIPIERIAVAQKHIMKKANRRGRPVITATQMLESMVTSRMPTRAEATDVANAILDGTDCVMLSGESAMGKYPVEAVAMLARIAASVEPHLAKQRVQSTEGLPQQGPVRPADLISLSLETMIQYVTPHVVLVPTRSGATARTITRFRLPVWIAAVSSDPETCRHLAFSYGVMPIHEEQLPDDWNEYVRKGLVSVGVREGIAMLIEGPSRRKPDANHMLAILDLSRPLSRSGG